MDTHAYVRGEIIKGRDDFEKGILALADWNPGVADRIREGSVQEWLYLLEHRIDEIVRRAQKSPKAFEE